MKLNPLKIFLCILASVAVLMAGCRKKGAQSQPMPPPVVTVAPVEQQEVVEWDEFTGRTVAIENVEVRPRVSGHIETVNFQSGQLVKKGDVLFQIDPRWHKAVLDQRAAEHEQAKVKLASAEREAKRTAQLLGNKAISTEEAEQRQARFQEASAALLAAQAARDTAQLDLDFTTIRSPIGGRISRALITEGNYVSTGNGTVLTTIVSVDPIYVYADLDENTLLKFNALTRSNKIVGVGEKVPVELQLADEADFPHRGTVESFDNKLDPNSGSILLRAVFPNAEGRIVPGLFARIRLPGSEKHNVLVIDDRSIGTDQAQKFVLALTSTNTVEYRPLKLGPIVNGRRIVRDGLKFGDRIVVNGLQRVRPGMPVQPQAASVKATHSPAQTAQR